MPLNEQTSSTFYKLTRQEDQLNNKASLPLIKKIQWLIFWIILSIGVYEWTNQIIKKDELQHFQQTDTFYLNQVNNKIKELENKDFSFFKKSWNIIGNEVLNLNETQQEIELDKIIELSNFTINEIIVTDKNGIITMIRNHNNNIAVENREERNYNITMSNEKIPEEIKNIDDSILNVIIECAGKGNLISQCTEAFRIIKQELELYKKLDIPLPQYCYNCRHYNRLQKRNPIKLWHRGCMCIKENHEHIEKCTNEFETSYAPERPEIIYCEKCYQQEVY